MVQSVLKSICIVIALTITILLNYMLNIVRAVRQRYTTNIEIKIKANSVEFNSKFLKSREFEELLDSIIIIILVRIPFLKPNYNNDYDLFLRNEE